MAKAAAAVLTVPPLGLASPPDSQAAARDTDRRSFPLDTTETNE